MEPQVIFLIVVAGGMLLLLAVVTRFSGSGSLNIKMKTVGNGQHGTARWATPKEISQIYTRVLFKTEEWRKGKDLPKTQGLILGSTGKKGKVTALVDKDDIHCLMIGASGVGKTAFFLYPNLEYACASGIVQRRKAIELAIPLARPTIPEATREGCEGADRTR